MKIPVFMAEEAQMAYHTASVIPKVDAASVHHPVVRIT